MTAQGWTEIVLTIASRSRWRGRRASISRASGRASTWLDPVLRPVGRLIYARCGVKADEGQNRVAYAMSMLAFSIASFVVLYLILRFQNPPLNPQGVAGLSPHVAFNTAVGFVTETNLALDAAFQPAQP
ncbi:potassium-transporting ATPase subunit KdpA [Phenylobacterium sp.]|uniref:potassium-transporting ATPase subunit KdpA n=1 Tax=Phenylobacterium sp. TaxID=1871053 RepID=UPI002F40C2EF